MKLSAFALDFDGTISIDGRLSTAVASAIAEVRRLQIQVLLVTGRRLDDLYASAGRVLPFDAIVAENGAVLEFPLRRRRTALAHPPPPAFLRELTRRGVVFQVGQSVVEADADASPRVLDALRALRLPLVMAFNRGRMMILPPAVAKSTGLRTALRALRLSAHNTVGIGDAENDHDLLDACEVGVAVGWGSPSLIAVADEVIRGNGPEAVAAYIRAAAERPRLAARQMGRRMMVLGHESSGEPVSLALRGRTILIGGEPGSGKSSLAGGLCEQLILQGYCVCVIDPEGDFVSLRSLPGVIVLGGEDALPNARELARTLEYPDVSVVLDLSRVAHQDKVTYVRGVLSLLNALRRRTGLPHKIVVDEAHYFLGGDEESAIIDPELAGYILVTYRLSLLPAMVRDGDTIAITCRESDAEEVEALLRSCRGSKDGLSAELFGALTSEEAALLPGPEEAGGRVRWFTVAPRLTEHVRHRSKYLDMPIAEAQAFVFGEGGRSRPRARSLKEFMALLESSAEPIVRGHLERHDFSRWIEHVFRDGRLAARIRTLESSPPGDGTEHVIRGISQAIRARYEAAPAPFPVAPHAGSAPSARST